MLDEEFAWKQRQQKRNLKALLAIPLFLLPLAAGYVFFTSEEQTLDVTVHNMWDPTHSDRVTKLHVSVHNPGPANVTPIFQVPAGALMNWYRWFAQDGPEVLGVGETGHFNITVSPYVGVPLFNAFRVIVNDAHHDSIRGISPLAEMEPGPRPSALNPKFEDWIPSFFTPYDVPYAWIAWNLRHDEDRTGAFGEDGKATLQLWPDMNRTDPTDDWTFMSLRQRIDFPGNFSIEWSGGDRSSGNRTTGEIVTGVLLQDLHANHQIYLLFSDNNATDTFTEDVLGPTGIVLGEGETHIIRSPSNNITVNLPQLFQELGWGEPTNQYVVRDQPHGAQDVGVGASMPTIADRLQLIRPMELKVFLASFPPHQKEYVEVTYHYAGGTAADPSITRG